MNGFPYCEAWPEELKEAERLRYRACCKVRCLESGLDRIEPSEFDALMADLEQARAELMITGQRAFQARLNWAQSAIVGK